MRVLDGSEIISSGTENCLNNLSAEDNDIIMTEVRTKNCLLTTEWLFNPIYFKAGQNDVCFTQIREELTNGTDLITLTRGIYRNQYASTASYPQYSNQTDESFTCSTNLCNDDSSTFRNRNANREIGASNPESFNEQFTGECYLCTDSPTSPNEACRNPTPELVASGTV